MNCKQECILYALTTFCATAVISYIKKKMVDLFRFVLDAHCIHIARSLNGRTLKI